MNKKKAHECADHLVARAEHERHGKSTPGYTDRKAYVTLDEMLALLNAGSHILSMNRLDCANSYFTEVLYRGYRFTTSAPNYNPTLYQNSPN